MTSTVFVFWLKVICTRGDKYWKAPLSLNLNLNSSYFFFVFIFWRAKQGDDTKDENEEEEDDTRDDSEEPFKGVNRKRDDILR